MLNSSSSRNSTVNFVCRHIPVYDTMLLWRHLIQSLLNLPVVLYVLVLGYRQWKPQRSFTSTSHSDVFTFNIALALLLNDVGTVLYLYDFWASSDELRRVASYLHGLRYVAELMIQCLTCVDRYLAVVHPVFYLKLKQRLGVVVRNVSLGIVWALALGHLTLHHLYFPGYPRIELICLLIAIFLVVSFCSVSVLRALTRRAPGDTDGRRMDQWKQRAFQTVTAITVIVLVWVVGVLSTSLTEIYAGYDSVISCLMYEVVVWLCVPFSLVLPALYLHRAGKLSCSIRQG